MQFRQLYSGSAGNLYAVNGSAGKILIDPGVSIRKVKLALNFKLSTIDGAIATHLHRDHCMALPDIAKAGINCYTLPSVAESLKMTGHRLNIIDLAGVSSVEFNVGHYKCLAFPAEHDVPNMGLLISDGEEKLLYLCDSYYSKYTFKGLTQIALGVNYAAESLSSGMHGARVRRLLTSHMSLENAIGLLKANDLSKCKAIYLLHLSDANSDIELFKTSVHRATGVPTHIIGCD